MRRRWPAVLVAIAALPYACSSSSPYADFGPDIVDEAGAKPDERLCNALQAQAFAAMADAEAAAAAADAACATNADCTVSSTASCAGGSCGQYGIVGGPAQVAIVEEEAKKQNATSCVAFVDAGCQSLATQQCSGVPPPPSACIAGACRSPNGPWQFFEFLEPTTTRTVYSDAGVSGMNPTRTATLSRADYDAVDAIMSDASFATNPSLGCDPPPDGGGTITFQTKTIANGAFAKAVDATGCVLGDAGNGVKTLHGIVSKY